MDIASAASAYGQRTPSAGTPAKPAAASSAAAAETANAKSQTTTYTVTVSLSAQAQTAMAATTATTTTATTTGTSQSPPNRYAPYFPTREGFSSSALSEAVADPGKSNTAGMNISEVATSARAKMDAVYSAMEKSGKPFDYNSTEGQDWNALMGDLDRRSLHAVSSNEGGQFTKQEQEIASTLMTQQQGLASGLYHGPSRLAHTFPNSEDHVATYKAAMTFLDAVSPEEKTSVPWAFNRAAAANSYTLITGDQSGTQDSDSPLAKLLQASMATMGTGVGRGLTYGPVRTMDDLLRQPWNQGFESQLKSAQAEAKEYHTKEAAAYNAKEAAAHKAKEA